MPTAETSIAKPVGQEDGKALVEPMIDAMGTEGLAESMWTREIHRDKPAGRAPGMPREPWADDEAGAAA